MAETLDDGAFWLPSHFLTDDDYLIDKENITRDSVGAGFRPNSLGVSMVGPSSALDSPVSSTEAERDQDEFLAELTRKLAQSALQETHKFGPSETFSRENASEKSWLLATSPQSTLAGFGSWSNRSGNGSPNGPLLLPSPPATPSEAHHDASELLFAAAGQVARLKMNAQAQMIQQNNGLLGARANTSQVPKNPNISGLYSRPTISYNIPQINQFERELKHHDNTIWGRHEREVWHCHQQLQSRGRCGVGGGDCYRGGALGLPQSAWPPLPVQHQQQQQHYHQVAQPQQGRDSAMRAVFLGGPGLKRQSTGTGVFLPRGFATPERRKKPACSTVLLPARVVHALNLDLAEMNAHPQPAFVPDCDAFMGRRRNAIWAQQRRSMRAEGEVNHEIRLPQDWTY
ncbi:hypothetical protein Nepgr_028651 [Nepenthes gracilis]|uniref:Uncharacterized protein n=1 Tax=Nepenthes gracilis TaxID=150966 RepID=A0AAD3TB59_NEPGR|nr:hypothetical protein Nepgr_028651 [Nepenthes gracilis]